MFSRLSQVPELASSFNIMSLFSALISFFCLNLYCIPKRHGDWEELQFFCIDNVVWAQLWGCGPEIRPGLAKHALFARERNAGCWQRSVQYIQRFSRAWTWSKDETDTCRRGLGGLYIFQPTWKPGTRRRDLRCLDWWIFSRMQYEMVICWRLTLIFLHHTPLIYRYFFGPWVIHLIHWTGSIRTN